MMILEKLYFVLWPLIVERFETNFHEHFTSGPLLFLILVGGVFNQWDLASQKSINQRYPCYPKIQYFKKKHPPPQHLEQP